jgi:hypothetical protein
MYGPKNHKFRWDSGYAEVPECDLIRSVEIELAPDLHDHDAEEVLRAVMLLMGFNVTDKNGEECQMRKEP